MAKTVSNLIFGTTFLIFLFSLHFLLINLQTGNSSINSDWTRNADYIGIDGENTPFPLRCDTCALVATSGHLTGSDLGKEIDDEHLCVFRLGFSPTKGYETDVGSRTTVRIVDSFRFYPFLKKPWKLVTAFKSDLWIVFDRKIGDISRFHGPMLRDLVQKYDSRFYWMSRKAEKEVFGSLYEQGYNSGTTTISALWFATKILRDAECEKLDVYGIPDPKICKQNLNVTLPSLYWEAASTPLCVNGADASYKTNFTAAQFPVLPSVGERKALLSWGKEHLTLIRFVAPSWIS